ncbi:hypothetical protein KTJ32_10360 [Acinetobacter gyllenbergii]|uniref:hypothetical protein n=1 Tax=Acinetobacter gyllenbergii TaxID=134534 RepID=UPI0021CF2466|nr:hypothetical protein [Acinetobacter gyllenbergii]MCU4581387.1 hypothetical protein [Acinetobacter gyllenbergii]
MCLNASYSDFNQQLLLKLTLGQQFKQTLKIPDVLQTYVPKQIDSAQDLLVLNQYWMLMQHAGYQARTVPETVQKSLNKIEQLQHEKQLDNELVQILKWIVGQESPFLYQDWVNQILKLAQQQQQVIPRYLVLKVLPLCRNPVLLASILPEFAFQGDVTTRLDDAKRVWKYLKQQDSAPLVRQLLKSKNSDWSLWMSQLCSQLPHFIDQHIAEFWSQSIQQNHLQSQAESLVLYNLPIKQFEALYRHVKTLEPQNAATVRKNAALTFYLYYPDNVLYGEIIALLRTCLSYDARARKVKYNINLDQDDALNDYGFFDREVNLVESRKNLKAVYQSAQIEQAYQAFCESSQGVFYLTRVLIQLPLAYWLEVFGTWDHLLSLHSQQREQIWNAFVTCCYREQRHDLALWFYQHQTQWCEAVTTSSGNRLERELVFGLLHQEQAIGWLLKQLELHYQQQNLEHFYFVFQHAKVLHQDRNITEMAAVLLQHVYATLDLQQDQKKFELLKERAQWLILEAYPIDFSGLQALFSISEWKQLIQFNQYKQKIIA